MFWHLTELSKFVVNLDDAKIDDLLLADIMVRRLAKMNAVINNNTMWRGNCS